MGRLKLTPCRLKVATAYVREHHRHSPPPQGGLFAVGVSLDDQLMGVAIAGRPVARMLDDGKTVEITRVCTLGEKNACSMLYGAICRAAKDLGYVRAVTYTLATETGSSLLASGFDREAEVTAREWSCPSRPRARVGTAPKFRWARYL